MNDRIVFDSRVQHGKPVIRGTCVPVTRIMGRVTGGMTGAEVTQEYGVTDDDVRSALNCAGELMEEDAVYPQPAAAPVIA